MHLEFCGEAACNGGEAGAQRHADNQSQNYLCRCGQAGEIKYMAEHRTGVDALVHDDGGSGHAHADHTADGQVRTCKEDQSCHAQSQEHSGGSLLKDIQHVVVCKQRHSLDNGRNRAQNDENNHDGDVQTIFQKEVSLVEGVLVVLPPLSHILSKGEL